MLAIAGQMAGTNWLKSFGKCRFLIPRANSASLIYILSGSLCLSWWFLNLVNQYYLLFDWCVPIQKTQSIASLKQKRNKSRSKVKGRVQKNHYKFDQMI